MLVIAHRGANKEAFENSWSAFDLAIAAGAQRIELDLQLSRDGKAVVFHDDDLSHLLGRAQRISELDQGDLRQIRLPNGEPLPFLEEVLERLLPQIELNLEIKGPRPALASLVAKALWDHPRRDQVIVSSFHPEPLIWLRDHAPHLKRACLLGSDNFSWPFFAIIAPPVFMGMVGTMIVHPDVHLMTANFMDQALARGWTVYPWVSMVGEDEDREALWTSLKTLGVHGLCTNYPRQLKSWLEEAFLDERDYRPDP